MESEEVLRLIEAAKKGDNKSFYELCDHYKGFIIKTAHDIFPGINFSKFNERDLLHAGNLGILFASKKYDRDTEFNFITYAGKWIEKELRKYIGSQIEPLLGNKLESESLDTKIEYEDDSLSKYGNLKDDEIKSPDSFMDEIIRDPIIAGILDKQLKTSNKIMEMYYGFNEEEPGRHTMKKIAEKLDISVKKVKSIKEDIEFEIKQTKFFSNLTY